MVGETSLSKGSGSKWNIAFRGPMLSHERCTSMACKSPFFVVSVDTIPCCSCVRHDLHRITSQECDLWERKDMGAHCRETYSCLPALSTYALSKIASERVSDRSVHPAGPSYHTCGCIRIPIATDRPTDLPRSFSSSQASCAGIAIGCLLGMFPLLFTKGGGGGSKGEEAQEEGVAAAAAAAATTAVGSG